MTKNIEPFKSRMDAETWQLYDMPNNETVANILNASLEFMANEVYDRFTDDSRKLLMATINIDNEGPDAQHMMIERAKKLQEQMRQVLTTWRHYGAYDSEPDAMLAHQIQECNDHYCEQFWGKDWRDYNISIEVGRFGVRKGADV
jgi:hypothetical protein